MTPRPSPSPPTLAEALLRVTLPGGGVRESVLGDLQQLFVERAGNDAAGLAGARRWYWAQALGLAAGYAGRRLRGVRYRGFETTDRLRDLKGDGMAGLVRQIRFSLRSLARSPGFTLPALLILAIGITAATAIYTVVDSIVFRPLDYPDSRRLVIICEDHPQLRGLCIASPSNVEDFRQASGQLSEVGVGRGWFFTLADEAGSRGVRGGIATAGFFRALGVQPAVGRLFTDDEYGPDRNKVVVLSHAFWTTRYGADPSVVGSTVDVEGEPTVIVGVLPQGFEAPFDMSGVQMWKPPHFDPYGQDIRRWRGFRAIGRLAPGATLASADAELRSVYAGIAQEHEEVNDEWRLRVTSLLDVVVGDTRTVLLAFLSAAGLLLVIVCANVANLLLARGLGRRRELAVRAALGAERGRLVRGILTESLTLTVLATLVSVFLASWATRVLLAIAPPMPRMGEVTMDGRVLAFAALLAVVATGLFAVLPALRVTHWDLAQTIKDGARDGDSPGSRRLRGALVVAELALSMLLLATAGLLTRSFANYLAWNPGFEPSSLMAFSAFANTTKLDSRAELFAIFRQAEERVAAIPGVQSVAIASAGPLFGGGDGATPYVVDGVDESGELPRTWWYDVGPGYFKTLGVSVLEGREFTEADGLDVAPVAVVNQTMARAAWPGESAVGKTVRLPERRQVMQVIGVVADVPPLTPGEAPLPEIYWSHRQFGRPAPFFLVRTSGDPAALSRAVTDAVLEVDPDMSLGTPRTLSSAEEAALVRPRFQALVILTFALAALALSAVGVYAVVAYAVARRVREMGIRMALGARSVDVLRLVLRSSLGVTVAGAAVGLAGSFLVGRTLQGMIHGVGFADPVSLGGAVLLLLVSATVAAYVPARRATRTDPVEAMRTE